MRGRPDSRFETFYRKQGMTRICGIDEVGIGCLAGPVVIAGVILPKGLRLSGINDSKKVSKKQRESLSAIIKEHALAYHIQEIPVSDIDVLNIWGACKKGIYKVVEKIQADMYLIDGKGRYEITPAYESIIGGDRKVRCISAASIIAKVHRDALMREYATIYPQYHFEQHKGYATIKHKNALKAYGACPIHRTSYAPVKAVLD